MLHRCESRSLIQPQGANGDQGTLKTGKGEGERESQRESGIFYGSRVIRRGGIDERIGARDSLVLELAPGVNGDSTAPGACGSFQHSTTSSRHIEKAGASCVTSGPQLSGRKLEWTSGTPRNSMSLV